LNTLGGSFPKKREEERRRKKKKEEERRRKKKKEEERRTEPLLHLRVGAHGIPLDSFSPIALWWPPHSLRPMTLEIAVTPNYRPVNKLMVSRWTLP